MYINPINCYSRIVGNKICPKTRKLGNTAVQTKKEIRKQFKLRGKKVKQNKKIR